MKWYQFYYNQLVTESEMNNALTEVVKETRTLAGEMREEGVFYGLTVTTTSPVSTSVIVLPGYGRIHDGKHINISSNQTVSVDQDEFGNPTYSDLLAGEGRWTAIYVRWKEVLSNPKTDGYGMPLFYDHEDGYEFFIHREAKGSASDRDTLPRPATLTSAIKLADIWFENGSFDIQVTDIDYSTREDYFRATIGSTTYSAGNAYEALRIIAQNTASILDLSNPDLPTGANDGAHMVGLGGTASQPEFQWHDGTQLNSGNNVHEAIAKIVSDLASINGAYYIGMENGGNTWHDGSDPFSNANLYDNINAIIGDLASNNGSDLIGNQAISSTYSGETLSHVAGSILDTLQSINDNLVQRINVNGDDRIQGNLVPLTNDSVTLGSNTNEWFGIYTIGVAGINTLDINSMNGALRVIAQNGNLQLQSSTHDVNIEATSGSHKVSLRASTLEFHTSTTHYLEATGNELRPIDDITNDLGDYSHKFRNVFAGRLDSGSDDLEIRTGDEINILRGLTATPIFHINGTSIYPENNGTQDLGDTGNNFRYLNLHNNGNIIFNTNKSLRKALSHADAQIDGSSWDMSNSGYINPSTTATRSFVIPLSFLKAGDIIRDIYFDISRGGGTLYFYLYRTPLGLSTIQEVGTSTAAGARQTVTLTANHTVLANNFYYLRVQFTSSTVNRYYGGLVDYEISEGF